MLMPFSEPGYPLAPPQVIGSVEAKLLERIHKEFSDQNMDATWAGRFGSYEAAEKDLFRMIRPVFKEVIRLEQIHRNKRPAVVHVTLSTKEVIPGYSQRPSGWHIDRRPGYSVASSLPTQFITAQNLAEKPSLTEEDRNVLNRGPLGWDEAKFDDLGLTIFEPQAREIVYSNGQLHRSVRNETTAVIDRTFLRLIPGDR